jgi:hypothetical protein
VESAVKAVLKHAPACADLSAEALAKAEASAGRHSKRSAPSPAASHGRADSLSFADGHCESRKWTDPRTTPAKITAQSYPPYITASPNNLDIQWLQERYTRPRK